jgi:hypothetical protein
MGDRLTLMEAAAELRKTPRWLNEWLRVHPTDKDGEGTAPRSLTFGPGAAVIGERRAALSADCENAYRTERTARC